MPLNTYIMKKIIIFIGLFFIGLGLNTVFAQGCEDGGGGEGVNIFGFFQPQYDLKFNGPDAKEDNTFKFKRARIGLTGSIPYDFSYYVVLENSAFVSGTGNPYLLDAFISYKRYKWFTVSVGSFKQPFGQEVNTSCSGLHTINRAFVSDQIVAPQRDMGIMILGGDKESKLNYAFAVMNGRGLGVADNNSAKDYIGRLTYKPLDFLRIGGSFRYGFPNTDLKDDYRMSYAGEVQIDYANFLLQGEYIYDEGDYNRAAGGGCGSDPISLGEKRHGAYVQALYMTSLNIQPVFKWEYFDAGMDDLYFSVLTFGVNYFFNDWTRLQLNYNYRAEKPVEIYNDDISLQLQVKF